MLRPTPISAGERDFRLRGLRSIIDGSLPVVAIVAIVALRLKAIRDFASSDSLIAAAAARDLLNGHLRGWIFAPAPFFVPDIAIETVLRAVRPDIDFAYLGYPFVSALLFYFVARRLAGLLAPDLSRTAQRWCAVAGVGLIAAPSFGVGSNNPPPMIDLVLGPSWHGGATLLVLVSLLLTERMIRVDRAPAAVVLAFGLLVFAGVLSDHLLIPQALLPIAIVVVLAWRSTGHRGVLARWLLASGTGTVLAFALERALPSLGYGMGRAGRPSLSVFGMFEAVHLLPRLVVEYPPWSLATVVVVAIWWRNRTVRSRVEIRERPIVVLLGLSVLTSGISTALLAFEEIGEFRRMQPVFVIPMLVAPTLLCRSLLVHRFAIVFTRWRRTVWWTRFGGSVGAVGVLAVVTIAGTNLAPTPTTLSAPAGMDCLDRLHSSGRLRSGLSDYWTARLYEEASGTSLRLVALWSSGALQPTTINMRPLIVSGRPGEPDLTREVNFIVPTRLEPATLRVVYGAPDEVINCDGLPVWRYNDGRLASGVRSLQQQARLRLQG